MSFESHQIDSSIGPDRGLPRRRIRMSERVQSHGELSEYATIPNPYNVCALFFSDVLFVLPLRATTLRCPFIPWATPAGEMPPPPASHRGFCGQKHVPRAPFFLSS